MFDQLCFQDALTKYKQDFVSSNWDNPFFADWIQRQSCTPSGSRRGCKGVQVLFT